MNYEGAGVRTGGNNIFFGSDGFAEVSNLVPVTGERKSVKIFASVEVYSGQFIHDMRPTTGSSAC
jgi:hypothetical protein